MNTWHATKSSGNGQGLVIDDQTGRNVAVTYDEKDASLVAAAPELLASLQWLVEYCTEDGDILEAGGRTLTDGLNRARAIVNDATGSTS